MMMQAIPQSASKAASISARHCCSRAATSLAMPPSWSNSMAGVETRGQSNLGNRATLRGSVFVRLMV